MKKKSEYIGINLIPELKNYLTQKAEKEFKSVTEVITDFIVQNYRKEKQILESVKTDIPLEGENQN